MFCSLMIERSDTIDIMDLPSVDWLMFGGKISFSHKPSLPPFLIYISNRSTIPGLNQLLGKRISHNSVTNRHWFLPPKPLDFAFLIVGVFLHLMYAI